MPFWRSRVVLWAMLCLVAGGAEAAICTPCAFTYAVEVDYVTSIGPSGSVVLTGSAQVSDADINRDLGSLLFLVQAQVNPFATSVKARKITVGSTAGDERSANKSDVLLTREGDVLLWIDSPDGPAPRLHATTTNALTKDHPFTFTIVATGSESPPVTFDFTISAKGKETYSKAVRTRTGVQIQRTNPDAAECRSIEGDVCLDPGCTLTSGVLVDDSANKLLEREFVTTGRCGHYRIKVTSTKWHFDCEDNLTGCGKCGSWYEGTVILDGTCPQLRAWSRSASSSGTVQANDPLFERDYSGIGGVLGSGLADTTSVQPDATFSATVANCRVGNTLVDCDEAVHFGIKDAVLQVKTDFSRPVQKTTAGNEILNSLQGIHFFGSFPFSPPNDDARYSLSVVFGGVAYADITGDSIIDVGPFSLWLAGTKGEQLWGTFDRGAVPTAFIDAIVPNPAVAGAAISFTGHGAGAFSGYEWFTHRKDQPGGPAVAGSGVLLASQPSFVRSDLAVGQHQIRFHVTGNPPSPFAFALLRVNQPPVAFINDIENVNDPVHRLTALLLNETTHKADPFHFDGGGIDFDGSIVAWEWKSSREGLIGTTPAFDASLSAVGPHTITLRVQDNSGIWSAPVTTTVTVRRPPVLLVHGICGDDSTWKELVDNNWLGPEWEAQGANRDVVHRVFDPNGDGMTNDSPAQIALLVADEIENMKSRFDVRKVDVVVHSMGGLATRTYIQGPAYRGDVHKLVMLGTPNHGSNSADLLLLSNGYSSEDVELYIPSLQVRALLAEVGLLVDFLDLAGVGSGLVCLAQDSPALHALRPHGSFVRNLNQTLKDEGTEDFAPSAEPDETISSLVTYFLVHGDGHAVSHTHLPVGIKKAIFIATLGGVDLDHMELAWIRRGDGVVTNNSLSLHSVTEKDFDHSHGGLHDSKDSVNQARVYLLDDPPPPPPPEPPLDQVAGIQLLGSLRGQTTPSAPKKLAVDAAATRLRATLAWEEGNVQALIAARSVSFELVLTSPSGVRYDTAAPPIGMSISRDGANLEATIDQPAAGDWTLEIEGTTGIAYRALAFQESTTFLAIGLSSHDGEPGMKVTIGAYLQRAGSGESGATVYAAVAPSGAGATITVPMIEDGRFPGLYTGTFTPQGEGLFNVLASADLTMANGGIVSRAGFTSFNATLRAKLTIAAATSDAAPRHGEAVRLSATVRNAGSIAAHATVVQFFDGPPQEGGPLLGTRTIDVPAGGSTATSILWAATAGAHRIFAIVDPMNETAAADPMTHVAEIALISADAQPPVARAGPDQVASVGQTVIFDGRASSDDDRIAAYSWLIGDGTLHGAYVALPGGFSQAGSYPVTLTVTDASGNTARSSLTVTVVDAIDTTPPVANAGRIIAAAPRAPVTFDGTRSSDDFGIAGATWDTNLNFDSDGDGDRGNDQDLAGLSPTLLRGYDRPGVYLARLTVRDAAGNGPSKSTVLVRVSTPSASECSVTVGPGARLDRSLAVAQSGDTVCLQPATYATAGISLSTPGVTLDGRGATLENSGQPGAPDVFSVGVHVRTAPDATAGITLRGVNVRSFRVGILADGGGHHDIADNAVDGGDAGIVVSSHDMLIERNRVDGSAFGYLIRGSDNHLRGNAQAGGDIGFSLDGDRHAFDGNQACRNRLADVTRLGSAGRSIDNACDTTAGFADSGRSACSYRCGDIRVLTGGSVINSNAFFPAGSFTLDKGLVITGTNVQVHFAGTELIGPEGVPLPAIEIRDAPGASVSGATITGFERGVLLANASDAELRDVEIRDAEIAVDALSGTNGRLRGVRAAGSRFSLRLDGSTSGWAVEDGELTGDVAVAGRDHALRRNHVAGEVDVTKESSGAEIAGNTIVSPRIGIALDSAGAAKITGNSIQAQTTGVLIHQGRSATIADNSVTAYRGILLDGGESGTISGNHVGSAVVGIDVIGSGGSVVRNNILSAKEGAAIVLTETTQAEVIGNDTRGSGRGIELQSSDRNHIADNVGSIGKVAGITLVESNDNQISGNTLSDIWPTGVLEVSSSNNRTSGNRLQPGGASPRDVTVAGIELADFLRDSPNVPHDDVARVVALGWESVRSFAGLRRLNPAKASRFFDRLASALGIFRELAASPRLTAGERGVLQSSSVQMARGAELTVRAAIADARDAGADAATLQQAESQLDEGIKLTAAGRPDLAVASFGQSWAIAGPASSFPARLVATMTVNGQFTELSDVAYTLTLTNTGPRTQADNPGDELFDRLPPELRLVDVTASAGTAALDRATNSITWNGSIPAGTSVRLTIRATILPGSVRSSVANQGVVKFDLHGDGLNEGVASTDDPTVPGLADATTFVVLASPAPPIPMLPPFGLVVLFALLSAIAVAALRR